MESERVGSLIRLQDTYDLWSETLRALVLLAYNADDRPPCADVIVCVDVARGSLTHPLYVQPLQMSGLPSQYTPGQAYSLSVSSSVSSSKILYGSNGGAWSNRGAGSSSCSGSGQSGQYTNSYSSSLSATWTAPTNGNTVTFGWTCGNSGQLRVGTTTVTSGTMSA